MFSQRSPIVLLLAVVVFIAGLLVAPVATMQDTDPVTEAAVQGTLTELYERVSPSVVAINVLSERSETGIPGQDGIVSGSGSGFVIDEEGHIVTNNHVVEGATMIEVGFFDGTLARGEIIGLDPGSDLAVIKVDLPAERLQPIEFADSSQLNIGEPVIAIGSPFGQRWTMTSGIISALERTIQGLTTFSIGGVIQTDAPINPGNSGGPLLDLEGRVVGVNSQIVSASGSSAGVGFAVPSNLVQKVAQALIEDGFVNYSYLGIAGGDVTLALMEAINLPNDTRGVVVGEATPGGPAARAGLQSAGEYTEVNGIEVPTQVDIITAVDGTPVGGIGELIAYLARETQPGDTVTLTVLRNGEEEIEIPVRLTPRP